MDPKKLKNAFAEHFAPIFHYKHFKMHQSIKNKEFEKSLEISRILLREYLQASCNSYYDIDGWEVIVNITNFIGSISKIEGFPFSESDLTDFLSTCEDASFFIFFL